MQSVLYLVTDQFVHASCLMRAIHTPIVKSVSCLMLYKTYTYI